MARGDTRARVKHSSVTAFRLVGRAPQGGVALAAGTTEERGRHSSLLSVLHTTPRGERKIRARGLQMGKVPQLPTLSLLLVAVNLSLGSLSLCLAQQQLGRVEQFERAEGPWPPPESSQSGASPTEGGSSAVSIGGGERRRGDGGEGGTEAHKIESENAVEGGYGGFLVPRKQGTKVCSPHTRLKTGLWRPSPGKYLLAYCALFGISNRYFCLQHHIQLASLMNRTLILLPSHPCERDFPKRATTKSLVDVPRLRECLMRANVANLSAYFHNSEAMPGEGPRGENATFHVPRGENGTFHELNPSAGSQSQQAEGKGEVASPPPGGCSSGAPCKERRGRERRERGLSSLSMRSSTAQIHTGGKSQALGGQQEDEPRAKLRPRSRLLDGRVANGDFAPAHAEKPAKAGAARWAVHQRVASDHETGLWAVTLAEFLELKGSSKGPIRAIIPWSMAAPKEECNAGGAFAFVPGGIDIPWEPEGYQRIPHRVKVNETWARRMEEAAAPFDVITFGDMFYVHVLPFSFNELAPLGPAFHAPCTFLLQPEKYVISAAAEFWRAKLGGRPYASMHLRLKEDFSTLGRERGWRLFNLEDSINCTLPKILDLGVKQVFVATDSPGLRHSLEEAFRLHGIGVVLYDSTAKPLRSPEDHLLIEKLVCAGASIFFRCIYSTFSMHIMLLRRGFATENCADEPICHGR